MPSSVSSRIVIPFFTILHQDLDKQMQAQTDIGSASSSGSNTCRLFFLWRSLGSLTTAANIEELCYSLIEKIKKKLSILPFPEKKKVKLFGQTSAAAKYEAKLNLWVSLLSCIRRIGKPLPMAANVISNQENVTMIDSVYKAACSTYPALARHALAILRITAEAYPSEYIIFSIFFIAVNVLICVYVSICICLIFKNRGDSFLKA
jgi:hypothetical protein